MLELNQNIIYQGREVKVVQIDPVAPEGSFAGDEWLYHLQDTHGRTDPVMDYEIANDKTS